MKFYEFTWRITEKRVHQEYQGYSDVIYYIGYDCLCDLRVYDPVADTESWYSSTTEGGMNLEFTPSETFLSLPSVGDDTIFEWLISNGLDRIKIEDDLRAKVDSLLPTN